MFASVRIDLPLERQAAIIPRPAVLTVLVPVAILLVFVLLVGSLGAIKPALLVMTNLSSAMVGGILAIYLLGINLSVSAAIGFVPLFGADVASGLILVTFFEQLRARGMSVREAVFEACRLRIRPLMMTSLAVLLGLVPMLLATGPGSEIQKPLVAVIFGGMVTSLAMTLLILPVLYMLVNRDGGGTSGTRQGPQRPQGLQGRETPAPANGSGGPPYCP